MQINGFHLSGRISIVGLVVKCYTGLFESLYLTANENLDSCRRLALLLLV